MNSVRWSNGWHEYELCAWWRRADIVREASLSTRRAWKTLPLRDVMQARNLLARFHDPYQLRNLLADDPICAVQRMSDHQVLDQVAGKLVAGQLLLRLRDRAADVRMDASSSSASSAPPSGDSRAERGARTHAGHAVARAASRNPAPRVAAGAPTQAALRRAAEELPTFWVEILLLGEDDKPIGGAEYRLELSDKTILTGCLGSDGLARHEGLLQGGDCRICFPQLDKDAWSFIRSEAA
jgi:hypothetical protein